MDRLADPAALAFPPISDYGVIGNLETVALAASSGAVEFFAYPHFDSPTLFAAMLDRDAGAFSLSTPIAPAGTQRYEPGTNVLVTTFEDGANTLEVVDFMPLGDPAAANQLARILRCTRGTAEVTVRCEPKFDYGRKIPALSHTSGNAVTFDAGDGGPVRLAASEPVAIEGRAAVVRATLNEGEALYVDLVCDIASEDLITKGAMESALADTLTHWREWTASSTYTGRWHDSVMRSALALKLMFSNKHGAIVAAPTFGLPEHIGGERNFDYRYCWIRDSAFTVYAMLRLGFTQEADHYRCWVRDRMEACQNGALQLMYRLDGSVDGLDEVTLDHLSGYRGSTPVRVGNAAFEQTQIDIYGEIVDSLYLAHKAISPVSEDGWQALRDTVDYVCANWRTKGSGIWEMRTEPRLFLDAILMTWVATDRALRLAQKTGFAANASWEETREAARSMILTDFWDEEIGAFTQSPGSGNVDAVVLLMPLVKFLPTTDERFERTMAAVEERLVKGPFVKRYEPPAGGGDGFEGEEGHFVTCSFWWIECLARAGRAPEAKALFEKMLSLASPLGLLPEEMDDDGTHLGNTPQALSHLSMISAACALNRALDNGGEPF